MIHEGGPKQEVARLLSLSINRVLLSREKFEEKLGTSLDHTHNNDGIEVIPAFRIKKNARASLRNWIDTKLKIDDQNCTQCIGKSASIESHKVVFEKYITKARADGKLDIETQEVLPWSDEIRGNPSPGRFSGSLPIYCNGYLVEGHVVESTTDSVAIMECASYLYCQLWWFRAILRRAVSTAMGFSASFIDPKSTKVSLLILEKPRFAPIGERFNLYEYQTSSTDELGHFLTQIYRNLPNPWQSVPFLHDYSPGCMLLSDDFLVASKDTPTCKVVPTQTGSLVLKCDNLSTAMELANATFGSNFFTSNDTGSSYYLKVKTPAAFGVYWDTVTIAIDATRSLLTNKWNQRNSAQKLVAKQWMAQYPLDSFAQEHCNMLVMRDCGESFHGQMSWNDLARGNEGIDGTNLALSTND